MDDAEIFDLGNALGSKESYPMQKFTIYLPNRKGNSEKDLIENIEDYIEAGMHILARINNGVTRMPPCMGIWVDSDSASQTEQSSKPLKHRDLTTEDTVQIYSFLTRPEVFKQRIGEIRRFLHKFGRETQQSAVWAEFFGEAPTANGSNRELYCRIFSIEQYDLA